MKDVDLLKKIKKGNVAILVTMLLIIIFGFVLLGLTIAVGVNSVTDPNGNPTGFAYTVVGFSTFYIILSIVCGLVAFIFTIINIVNSANIANPQLRTACLVIAILHFFFSPIPAIVGLAMHKKFVKQAKETPVTTTGTIPTQPYPAKPSDPNLF